MASPHPTLADLIDLHDRLVADEEVDPQELARRDRRIGRELDHLAEQPPRQLAAWLHRVDDEASRDLARPLDRHDHWATRVQRLATLGVLVFGLLIGIAAAAGVFSYRGDHPVNVVWVLAVFVALPMALLMPWALAAVPSARVRWLPGAVALHDAAVLLSPGRVVGLAKRWLPQTQRDRLERFGGSAAAHSRQYGRVHRWTVLAASQALAGAAVTGGLLALLVLVVFSDLAFAWSTTLDVSPEAFHDITAWVAWPWGWLLPQAVPSAELVRSTQYYRLDPARGGQAALDAAALGGWWPFLAMAMLTYGVLPRLATFAFSRWRLSRAIAEAMARTPGAERVLQRLNGPLVETSGEGNLGARVDKEKVETPPLQRGGFAAAAVINWAGVPLSDEAVGDRVGNVRGVWHAGGGRSLEEDAAVVREVAASMREPDIPDASLADSLSVGVVVLVKAWEPPLLEAVDFLRDLRDAVGDGVPMVVVPLDRGEDGRMETADAESQGVIQWRKRVRASGDPWLSVGRL